VIDLVKEHQTHQKTYKLLNEILPQDDPSYSAAAFFECQELQKNIEKFMPFKENNNLEIKGIKGDAYFKINFKEHVIQFVPSELKHLRTLIDSTTFNLDDKKYTYGFIPSYIPNINHLTLRVTQNENEINREISKRKDLDSYNMLTWDQKYTAMSIDTLNRFNKENSEIKEGISDKKIQKYIRQCFEFCNWYLPEMQNLGKILFFDVNKGFGFISRGPGTKNLHFGANSISGEIKKDDIVEFEIGDSKKGPTAKIVRKMVDSSKKSIIHNFLYDKPRSIADIISVRKTIARIDQLEEKERTITLVDRNFVSAFRAKITFLTFDGSIISTKSTKTYISKNVISGLSVGDLINCISCKSISTKKIGTEFSNFCIIGCINEKIKNDIRPFIGLTAWKIMQNMNSTHLCRIVTKSEFIKNLFEIISLIDKPTSDNLKNSTHFDEIFIKSLEGMYPLFILKDDQLYHNPPALITHLACYYPHSLQNKEFMTLTATMIDYLLNNFKEWGHVAQNKMRISTQGDEIQNMQLIDFNHFIKSLPLIANRIVYSRLYSQHWKKWIHD
tara:strand:+ start:10298 stop:11968 length:1671 start_codon:yes stop_codon:yes gene_type:complete